MEIRNYKVEDASKVMELDRILGLSLQWHGGFHAEDAYVACEGDRLFGVCALAYDTTWYYLDQNRDDIPCYKLNLNLAFDEHYENFLEMLEALIAKAKEKIEQYREKYPTKKIAMSCFVENRSIDEMDFYLRQGLIAYQTIWVLGFDLTDEIPSYSVPEGITIDLHDFAGDGMQKYMAGNVRGFDGVQDSEDELRFRLGGPDTAVYTAKDGDSVVSSVTIWGIGDGRSATENIFTVPEYRHKNIARATLAKALRVLKDRGETLATLTCIGDNTPALSMYYSMGFELKYFLVEMHY